MPGPNSMPAGDRARWEEMNEIVCNIHFHCNMAEVDKDGNAVKHEYMTYRVWLANRGKLRTGKTV